MSDRRFKGIFWSLAILTLWGSLGAVGVSAAEEKEGDKANVAAQIGAANVCPCTFGPLIAESAIPIDKGKFSLQTTLGVSITGGSFSSGWRRVSAGGDFVSLNALAKFTYGILPETEVAVATGYLHNWASGVADAQTGQSRSADFGGWTDTVLGVKRLLREDAGAWPAISAFGAVTFPSGHHHPLNPSHLGADEIGGGAYRFTGGLNMSKWVSPCIFYGNLWYSSGTTAKSTVENEAGKFLTRTTRERDAILANLAVEWIFKGQGPWVGLFEVYSVWEVGPLFGPRSTDEPAIRIGILPGIEYVVSDRLAFALGVSIDLAGRNTDITYTPIISALFVF